MISRIVVHKMVCYLLFKNSSQLLFPCSMGTAQTKINTLLQKFQLFRQFCKVF